MDKKGMFIKKDVRFSPYISMENSTMAIMDWRVNVALNLYRVDESFLLKVAFQVCETVSGLSMQKKELG